MIGEDGRQEAKGERLEVGRQGRRGRLGRRVRLGRPVRLVKRGGDFLIRVDPCASVVAHPAERVGRAFIRVPWCPFVVGPGLSVFSVNSVGDRAERVGKAFGGTFPGIIRGETAAATSEARHPC